MQDFCNMNFIRISQFPLVNFPWLKNVAYVNEKSWIVFFLTHVLISNVLIHIFHLSVFQISINLHVDTLNENIKII